MAAIFQNVKPPKLPYNNFPLGREVLLSGQIGKLIPIQCDEVVPGDRFNQNIGFLIRFSPLSAPVMARFNVHFHSFYVPYRIITPESSRESTYERFIKSIGKDESEVPDLPYITAGSYRNTPMTYLGWQEQAGDGGVALPSQFGIGSLWDYLGLTPIDGDAEPLKSNGDRYVVSIPYENRLLALPFFAYQYIYNDFYRRDQIEREIPMPLNVKEIDILDYSNFLNDNLTFGNDETYTEEDEQYWQFSDPDYAKFYHELFALRTRNYERDYFTSALPEPQFGDDVYLNSGELSWIGGNSAFGLQLQSNDPASFSIRSSVVSAGSENLDAVFKKATNGQYSYLSNSGNYGLFGSLSGEARFTNAEAFASNFNVGSITVNDFRIAIQLQGVREKINRGGTRYLEIMQSIYGVTVPDARIQRPIYLGGCKNSVDIGTIVQTSESASTPQGNLTGKMTAAGGNKLFYNGYEFKEHGYILTIMSVTPRTSYYGGTPRKFLKRYPEDFFISDFDHLGEQEIQKRELFDRHFYEDSPGLEQNIAAIRDTFGYTPRYSELKSSLSSVHGEFRTTLDNWHVSRDFDSLPSLSSDFIKAEPEDFSRIFEFENIENTSNEHFQAQIYIDVIAKRRMSKYSTPWTLY